MCKILYKTFKYSLSQNRILFYNYNNNFYLYINVFSNFIIPSFHEYEQGKIVCLFFEIVTDDVKILGFSRNSRGPLKIIEIVKIFIIFSQILAYISTLPIAFYEK